MAFGGVLKMSTTTLWSEVLIAANELSEMFLQSEAFVQYRLCKQQLLADGMAQQLIKEFHDLKVRYEEVERFGVYHPDYKSVSTDIRQAKRKLDSHDVIAKFKKAESEVEEWLNEISRMIAHEVSPSIKVPTGNPFFDQGGCSGCGSGNGCACGA